MNPTLSAIPKTTKIHESPQSLELSGLFLFLRFKNTHEKSQTATKKGATLGASNVAPVYFKQELLPMPEKLTDTAIRGAKPLEKAYKLADGGGLCLEVAPMRPSIR